MAQVADPTLAAYNHFIVSKVGHFLESVLQVAMAADDLKQNQQLFHAVGCEGVAIERNCKSIRMCSRRQCFKESYTITLPPGLDNCCSNANDGLLLLLLLMPMRMPIPAKVT
jgi:hypothetical protein